MTLLKACPPCKRLANRASPLGWPIVSSCSHRHLCSCFCMHAYCQCLHRHHPCLHMSWAIENLSWIWGLIAPWNYNESIEYNKRQWIECSKLWATKNWWSYHLVSLKFYLLIGFMIVGRLDFFMLLNLPTPRDIHMIVGRLDLLFNSLH